MGKLIRVTFSDGSVCWLDVVQYVALDPRTVVAVALRPDLAVTGPTAGPVSSDCHTEILAPPVADR